VRETCQRAGPQHWVGAFPAPREFELGAFPAPCGVSHGGGGGKKVSHGMTFSCPHFDMDHEYCMRLSRPCVPGRPGCVLRNNSVFATPVEDRLAEPERAEPGEPWADSAAEN